MTVINQMTTEHVKKPRAKSAMKRVEPRKISDKFIAVAAGHKSTENLRAVIEKSLNATGQPAGSVVQRNSQIPTKSQRIKKSFAETGISKMAAKTQKLAVSKSGVSLF